MLTVDGPERFDLYFVRFHLSEEQTTDLDAAMRDPAISFVYLKIDLVKQTE